MRTFYAFHVNEFYSNMYYYNESRLYNILEELFYKRHYDKFESYKLYRQVVVPFNKMLCNGYIIKKNRLCYEYFHDKEIHYMKKTDEHTKMTIGSIHIKIISNINFPCFFEDVNELEQNIFVCDFDNRDFFWLDKVAKKYGQRRISIVE